MNGRIANAISPEVLAKLQSGEIKITLADVQAELLRRKRRFMDTLFPDEGPLRRELYIKHVEFFAAGADYTERYFRAANRSGKSEAGAYEVACHLTGQYPHWWVGRRFAKPINALIAGESGRLVRDSIQMKMLGLPSDLGTGMIPFDTIIERRNKPGIPDAIDTVRVRHVSGGDSIMQLQSFDQGREAFQATARDLVWLDEEPPLSVYSEALTRTMTTQGLMITTFTPLKGMSDTIIFLEKKADEGKILRVTATWDDAPHLSEADKAKMIEAYPLHQRDARTKGIPALGSGAIYPVPESDVVCEPFELPAHWRRVYGMDVGWNRTAVVWGAYDEANDIVYLYGEYYRGQAEPSVHADAIKQRGDLPGVIDPAARGRAQKDGEQLLQLYIEQGLNIVVADNSREAGIYEVYQRLSSGRLKVFKTLQNWLNEYRIYRRDDKGAVVKQDDHLMDCCVVGSTMVQTDCGPVAIQDLVGINGKVLTRDGAMADFIGARKTIINSPIVQLEFNNGDTIRCTPDHPFLTPHGWVEAVDMMDCMGYSAKTQRQDAQWNSGMVAASTALNTLTRMVITSVGVAGSCIAWSIQSISARYRRAMLFTTRMVTNTIMIHRISKQWSMERMLPCTASHSVAHAGRHRPQMQPQNSSEHLKGAQSAVKSYCVPATTVLLSSENLNANNAAINLLNQTKGTIDFVQMPAKLGGVSILAKTMKNVIAWNVARLSLRIATLRQKHVPKHALLRCVGVQWVSNEDVYCLTVPGIHAFAIGNGGIVVHNTRYLCMSGIAIAGYAPAFMQGIRETNGNAGSHGQHTYDYNPLSRQRVRDMLK